MNDPGYSNGASADFVVPDLVPRARDFAIDAHRRVGQLRKYTGLPYEEHLRAVAEIVAGVNPDPEVIAAAWLHDVVEDTPTTIEDIERSFGPAVRALVDALTDVSQPQDGNRAARKALDREHLAHAPAPAQTIKLADLIDNGDDICRNSPRFGRVYLREMAALLDVLDAGDATLMRRARRLHATWTDRLAKAPAAAAISPERPLLNPYDASIGQALRVFRRSIRARDVAERLPGGGADPAAAPPSTVGGGPVLGVRIDGRTVSLLDCLQLSDKIRLLLAFDQGPQPLLRGQSKAESQRLARDLEDLRNNLAHAQDVVTHDWVPIARLARRLEELASRGRE